MKKLTIAIGLLVSLVFLWLALRHTSWPDIYQAFQNANPWYIIPLFGCLIAFYWLRAARWQKILLSTYSATKAELLTPILIGAAGNNLLPAHLGEVVRIYYTGEKLKIPKSTVLATLIVERVFDLLAGMVIFSVALFFVPVKTDLKLLSGVILALALSGYLVCWAISRYSEIFIRLTGRLMRSLPGNLSEKLMHHAERLAMGMSSVSASRGRIYLVMTSLLQWLFMTGCIFMAMQAFGVEAGFATAAVVLGITIIGLLLPTSPGFFGTIEYAFVLGLSSVGINSSTAFSIAIFYHLPIWFVICLSGLFLFLKNGLSLAEVRQK